MWPRFVVATALAAALGCGDNVIPIGEPLAQADTLILIAHFDDDMIFMQPELADILAAGGSVTTVYISSGDLVDGPDRAEHSLEASLSVYGTMSGTSEWDCGYLSVAGSPVHHCRLRDRAVSLIGLDTADGGVYGTYANSSLHLVEGQIDSLPIVNELGGGATVKSIVDTLAAIITATQPTMIHTLDLAATHGYDHSGHMFGSTFAFWAAAQLGYPGPIRWHRGYNVENEAVSLVGSDYDKARTMLGFFEACYFDCAPCGTECTTIDHAHDVWVQREYFADRDPITATGVLASQDLPGLCLTIEGAGSVTLADCATATPITLEAGGHLTVGGQCLASSAGLDQPVVVTACADVPAQYWMFHGEGFVFNGTPVTGQPDMEYDHVRCLAAPTAGAAATAPVCGSRTQPRWQLMPAPMSSAPP